MSNILQMQVTKRQERQPNFMYEMIMHLCIMIHMKQLVTDKTKRERERERESDLALDDRPDHRRPYTRGDRQVQVDIKNYE